MASADFLSPKPGLIVHGVEDAYCSPEGAKEAYDRMSEPKQIVWLDAKLHVDLYDNDIYVTQAVDATGPSSPNTCSGAVGPVRSGPDLALSGGWLQGPDGVTTRWRLHHSRPSDVAVEELARALPGRERAGAETASDSQDVARVSSR